MADAIKHVIVLMMENRSFDHILGALPGIDGAPMPPNSNLQGPGSSTSYDQLPNAARKIKPDPGHEFNHVMRQIRDNHGLGPMGGFVYDFALEHPNLPSNILQQVMSFYPLGDLPATHELAGSFCVSDRWFASVPGPTWTNRFFMHSATSQGWVNMPDLLHLSFNLHAYDQETIYERLNQKKVPWAIYFGDVPQSLLLSRQRKLANLKHYHMMDTFYEHVHAAAKDATGFPAYSFIEPTYFFGGQNDQHPPSDVLKGDQLIASVYNAVRGSAALWESTMLIVLYDEHGGFYDHVPPPPAVPPDHKTQEGCPFDLYGVRVPAIIISRYAMRGAPFRPAQGTYLDHTSVLRYLEDKFGLAPLTNRDASAASVAGALTKVTHEGPEQVGTQPAPAAIRREMTPDLTPHELNANQAALIAFTRQLEAESAPSARVVGRRALQAAISPEAEVVVARERVVDYFTRKVGRAP